jgi:hypothetical protein
VQKDWQTILQNIKDFNYTDDGFGSVFVPDCIDIYCGLSCDYYQPCDNYNCVRVRVFCLLTLSVNKCYVIFDNALFFSHFWGSNEADKVSRSTFCLKYWSQFINHEILTISFLRWYIANILMRCVFVSFVDEVLNCNHLEYLTFYAGKEAICMYQTC